MFDIYIMRCKLPQADRIYKYVDIGISNGKIESIVESKDQNCKDFNHSEKKLIDAKGLYAMCGFIDNHSHTDEACFNSFFQSKIAQGITTEICGNCGGAPAPISNDNSWKKRKDIKEVEDSYYTGHRWSSFNEYFNQINIHKAVCNQISLAGWWSLYDDCQSQRENESKMLSALGRAFQDGCFGLSINQANYSWTNLSSKTKKEIFHLMSQYEDRIFTVHLADYSNEFIQSVNEIQNLSSLYNIITVYSHMKFYGEMREKNYKYFSQFINQSEAYFDIYPFNSICTRLSSFLKNFRENVKRFKASKITLIRMGIEYTLSKQCDLEKVEYELKEQFQKNGETLVMVKCIDENFMNKLLCNDKCFIGTDYSSCLTESSDRLKNHPRAYETFTNAFSILLENRFSLYEVNNRLVTKQAEIWKLKDRGKIEEGNFADIVLLSIDKFNQMEIQFVILNGKLAFSQEVGLIEKSGIAITR